MSGIYVTFKKFPDATEAKHLQQLLIENGIECTFIDNSPRIGGGLTGGELLREYEIQLKQSDFEKAHHLLEQHAEEMMNGIDQDYYLLSFTDEELHDVVLKQDEWSEFDYVLARRLLEQRGKPIDEAELTALRRQRIAQLARPENHHKGWIVAGYIFSLLGGFFGVIIGYVIWSSRKTLPNGQVVHTYTIKDRAQGRIIFITGIIILLLCVAAKVFAKYIEIL
jgi:hypothetical protein